MARSSGRRSSRRSSRVSSRGTPLGELLIQAGAINTEQLTRALKTQESDGGLLGQILAGMDACTSVDIVAALNKQFRITGVDLSQIQIPAKYISRVSKEDCKKGRLVPFELLGNMLCVAMANVLQRRAINDIQEQTGFKVKAFSSTWPEIQETLEKFYTPEAEGLSGQELAPDAPASEFDAAPELDAAPEAISVDAGPATLDIEPAREAKPLPEIEPISLEPEPAAEPPQAPAAPAPAGDEAAPFSGDPSTWRREGAPSGRRSTRSDLKREIMARARGEAPPEPAAPPPAAESAPPPSFDDVPMLTPAKSEPMPKVEELVPLEVADLTQWCEWDVRADNPGASDADLRATLEAMPEIKTIIDDLPVAGSVARSRQELFDMAAAAAEAEAAVANLDIEDIEGSEDVTLLDIPHVSGPVPAEPIREPVSEEDLVPVGEAEGTPILDAAPAAPPPPLPAVVAAEKVSDTEFSEAVGAGAEPDPVQEWEALVFASAPVAAHPIN